MLITALVTILDYKIEIITKKSFYTHASKNSHRQTIDRSINSLPPLGVASQSFASGSKLNHFTPKNLC